jgi:uncharacterized protein (DUF1786 family)
LVPIYINIQQVDAYVRRTEQATAVNSKLTSIVPCSINSMAEPIIVVVADTTATAVYRLQTVIRVE